MSYSRDYLSPMKYDRRVELRVTQEFMDRIERIRAERYRRGGGEIPSMTTILREYAEKALAEEEQRLGLPDL